GQSRGIELAVELDVDRQVEGGRAGVQAVEEPEALLGEGERQGRAVARPRPDRLPGRRRCGGRRLAAQRVDQLLELLRRQAGEPGGRSRHPPITSRDAAPASAKASRASSPSAWPRSSSATARVSPATVRASNSARTPRLTPRVWRTRVTTRVASSEWP